jgi:putative peptidoglycan lipid II flippase
VVRPRLTERVRRLVILATPIAIGGGAQQINLVLDVVWASLMPAGAISALYYADRLAQLPLGVAGVAIGTALLPLLARNLRAGDETAAMGNQNRAVELGLLFALPAAVALWLLAEPIVRLLFERGQFTPADTLRTASALAAFAIGIPAFVAIKALTPGFFAREDTKTPLYTAVASIVVNVVLNVVFLYATSLQHVGIALASSLAGWLNAALLAMILISRGHWRPDARLLQRSFGIVLASAGMGVLLWLAMRRDASDLMVLAYCVGGGAIYAVLGMLLRVIRLDELRAAFRRPPGVKREAGDVD